MNKESIIKKIVIQIDTSNNKEIIVGLKMDGKDDIRRQIPDHRKAQVILPLLEKMLKEYKLELKDVTAIEVNQGPGSFTGLRVGITIANTLGFLLKVPVNEKTVGEQVEAIYS
jgi:tRNA threonylcarbamoyladenosine biosynthesis protein TsaB